MAARGTVVQDWRDVMVMFGLGSPVSRAFVAGVGATALLYATGYPAAAFNEEGGIKPLSLLSPGPDGVGAKHFLVLPVAIATGVFLFT